MSVYKSDKEAFVRQAVESILSQTCGDFDLYILFDGPVQKGADDYLYALIDERVHIMSREKNKGLAFSLNELLEEALPKDYEYIARMDADDVSLPERFEKQISYLDSHPDMDCAGSWADPAGGVRELLYRDHYPDLCQPQGYDQSFHRGAGM